MTSRRSLYTVCRVWGTLLPFFPGKSHIIERMEEEVALFKILIPSRDGAKAPVGPEPQKEVKSSGFADRRIADR